tara:strand:- start:4 stop:396 length:393 start_codon:yes stop_codon:yes gene_type:complete
MAHFAKVKDRIVTKVIVAEQEFIDNYVDGEVGEWVQTSYNTQGGKHWDLNADPPVLSDDQSKALRKNYVGIGDIYDDIRDAFYKPQPYPSWTLNEDTCYWEAPVAKPDDNEIYEWNEENQNWEQVTPKPE